MAERIGVEPLSEGPVEVIAGGRIELRFKVQNVSQIVDQYDAEVLGLGPGWASTVRPSVALFPGDSGEITIALHPPGGTESQAGRYAYLVRVVSRDSPADYTEVPGEFNVLAFGGIEAELRPERVEGRRGLFHVELRNLSNQARGVALRATDAESILLYRFQRHAVELPVAGEESIPLEVVPPRRPFAGPPQEHRFLVEATEGPEGEERVLRAIEGTYAYKPVLAQWPWARLPLWAQRALPFLALALAALGLYLATRPQAASDTAVAPAPAAQTPAGGGAATPTAARATPTPSPVATLAGAATPAGGAGGAGATPPAGQHPPNIREFKTERRAEGGAEAYYVVWAVAGAARVTLNGRAVGNTGSQKVEPVQSQEFVLQATNRAGSLSQSVGLVVLKPPVIKAFTADRTSVNPGDRVRLRWQTENALRADIAGEEIPQDRL
ncbi:MAG: hypothetical protein HYY05_01480, partial [Chloroflexi bacterium]|nr:hypothetical protein [Chloroflexota bacterium]